MYGADSGGNPMTHAEAIQFDLERPTTISKAQPGPDRDRALLANLKRSVDSTLRRWSVAHDQSNAPDTVTGLGGTDAGSRSDTYRQFFQFQARTHGPRWVSLGRTSGGYTGRTLLSIAQPSSRYCRNSKIWIRPRNSTRGWSPTPARLFRNCGIFIEFALMFTLANATESSLRHLRGQVGRLASNVASGISSIASAPSMATTVTRSSTRWTACRTPSSRRPSETSRLDSRFRSWGRCNGARGSGGMCAFGERRRPSRNGE